MMNRPWMRWLWFGLCLAVFIGAMLWITQRALRLEEQRREAEGEAQVLEKVRLALWRMEAEASAVVVRESARPAYHYQPFHALEDLVVQKEDAIPKGGVRLPSPLLGTLPELVKLHFERALGPAFDVLCSPQTPVGGERELALERYAVSREVTAAAGRLAELELLLAAHPGWERGLGWDELEAAGKPGTPMLAGVETLGLKVAGKDGRDFQEQLWRNNTLVQNAIQQQTLTSQLPAKKMASSPPPQPLLADEVGGMRAVWLGGELLLARKVRLAGMPRVQGVWVDWASLRARLLASSEDLLPQARLEPVDSMAAQDDWMALVTLPVRLVPGAVPLTGDIVKSALKPALLAAWACLIAAAAAIALVLHRAVQLSERRAAFVSAVTHELRTPLTTFQLYSEMLAEDMVPEEEQRRTYLRTLCEESTRLMHLVENVLSFSRIERGRPAVRLETVTVAELLERFESRLRARCTRASLELEVSATSAARLALVKVDVMMVEQILLNLVDNACKYAAPDSNPGQLQLGAGLEKQRVLLTLRDYGPGLPPQQMRKLFRPFSKSATEAAHSAPGVGLGLALSRRLARELGGDLTTAKVSGRGAAFCLSLEAQVSPV